MAISLLSMIDKHIIVIAFCLVFIFLLIIELRREEKITQEELDEQNEFNNQEQLKGGTNNEDTTVSGNSND